MSSLCLPNTLQNTTHTLSKRFFFSLLLTLNHLKEMSFQRAWEGNDRAATGAIGSFFSPFGMPVTLRAAFKKACCYVLLLLPSCWQIRYPSPAALHAGKVRHSGESSTLKCFNHILSSTHNKNQISEIIFLLFMIFIFLSFYSINKDAFLLQLKHLNSCFYSIN